MHAQHECDSAACKKMYMLKWPIPSIPTGWVIHVAFRTVNNTKPLSQFTSPGGLNGNPWEIPNENGGFALKVLGKSIIDGVMNGNGMTWLAGKSLTMEVCTWENRGTE